MAMYSSVAARNAALAAELVTLLGATATAELWNGAFPVNLAAPAGVKLATLNLGNPAGVVASGVFTIAGYTQTKLNHVTGTPTFLRLKDSSAATQHDIGIGAGAGNIQYNGTVINNQDITGTFTITAPNPAA